MKRNQISPQRLRAAIAGLGVGALACFASLSAKAQIQWLDADLSGSLPAGSAVQNGDGSVTITGGGSDIWNDTSQFNYYYAWAEGTSWTLTGQFVSFSGPDDWSKVELMVDWADPVAGPQGYDPFIAMMDTQPASVAAADGSGNGVAEGGVDQYRTASGGPADWLQAGNTPAPNYPNNWFQIVRNGSVFTLNSSPDGVTWSTYITIDTSKKNVIGQDNGTSFGTPWPNLVCAGVAVTAHNQGYATPAVANVANLSATFPPATPPTVLAMSQQIQAGVTNTFGCEASLSFAATNNAFPAPSQFPVNYQWYKNGTAIANANSSTHTWLLDTSDKGAAYTCKAALGGQYSGLTVSSATALVGVTPGVYHTNGLKCEFFSVSASSADGYQTNIENGNCLPASSIVVLPNLDQPGGFGNDYVSRVSGWFIPPTSDTYHFFNASDDTSDLFLSTDATFGHKVLIAQSTDWCNQDQWGIGGVGAGAGDQEWTQQSSDTFTSPTTLTLVYPNGIQLTAGTPYYIEQDHWQGGGGDEFSVTYQTSTMEANPNWYNTFTNGSPSLLYATNNNIMFVTRPVTFLTWVAQPTNYVATAGFGGVFYALAATDSEFSPSYTWYKNGAVAGTTTSPTYTTPATTAADNGSTFYVVATTAEKELSITSSVATLTVSSPVLEKGWAFVEYWYNNDNGIAPFYTSGATNATTGDYNDTLVSYPYGPDYTIYEPRFESSTLNSAPANYMSRLTALFYPPTTGLYDFYISSDDNGALFVSTDSTAAHAVMVAQETQWSSSWEWTGDEGNNATVAPQKCSASWVPAGGSTPPWGNGIQLTAGQPYYVALIHQDTGGGNHSEATFAMHNAATAPADGTYSAMAGNLIASYAPRSFSVTITQQPTNTPVPFGGLATFTAAGTTDSGNHLGDENNPANEWTNSNYLLTYQWTYNGAPIPGANAPSFSFGPVSPLDNNAQIVCQMRSLGYVNNSQVDIWSNSTPAVLTVTGNAVYESGFALQEFFSLNPGVPAVANNLAGAPTWLMATPAFEVDTSDSDDGGVYDNFTDEIVGFFIPPSTGLYTFYGNSDDNSELFLSTTSSSAAKVMVAQETGWNGALDWTGSNGGTAGQEVSTLLFPNGIQMTGGQKYFIQLVHHQGGGGTWCGATETAFNAAAPANGAVSVIRGALVGTYVPACTYVTVTNEPQSQTVPAYSTAKFTAGGATDSQVPVEPETSWWNSFNNFLFLQWYMNGQPVAGANGTTLSVPDVLPLQNGSTVYCTMRALGYGDANGNPLWATSSIATLNVITGAPPTLVYESVYTNYAPQNFLSDNYAPIIYVDVTFSTSMDPTALLNLNNYVFSAGSGITAANVTSITVNSNSYREVELALNQSPRLPFTVTVNGMKAQGGGPVLTGNTSTNVSTVALTCLDIGTFGGQTTFTGNDPAVPTTMYVDGAGAYTVQCEGSDIWNDNDGFNFLYEAKTGSFDVVVRQIETTHVSNWTKGGLMIREVLDQFSRDYNIINDPDSGDGIEAIDGSGYGANTVECNARTTYGNGSASWAQTGPPMPPTYPNAWVRLKLQRIGSGAAEQDIITAFNSTNGFNWQQLAQVDAATNGTGGALANPVYVGICSTAHDNDGTAGPANQYIDTSEYANYNSSFVPITVLPTLKVVNSGGGNVTISWTPNEGTLYSSPALTGPGVDWQPIGTANPAVIPITGTAQYFRVKL